MNYIEAVAAARKSRLKDHMHAVVCGYSEIVFLPRFGVGILLLIATLLNLNVAIAGMVAVLSAHLFAKFIDMDKEFFNSGYYTYNPLLVGLAIGYLFKITPLTIFFVVSAGVLTLVFTIMLNSVFATYLKLPILSLPFATVSSIAYLASSKYSNLFVNGLYNHQYAQMDFGLPLWATGFFKCLGSIFFLPYVIPGVAVAAVILCSSRILFLLGVAGYYVGSLIVALLMGSYTQAFSNLNHFNFILIAMAIGGVFLIPSLKSYCLALVAVCASTMLINSMEVFWSYNGIPGFTLPFNLISLSFVYVLGLINYPHVAKFIRSTPEETLDHFLANARRHNGSYRPLYLPFAGAWTIWQGFDGQWTHQGSQKYAYDFIIMDDEGSSHRNGGDELADYYAFKKAALSPMRGRVAKVVDGLPDNPIGIVDKANPWGNLIVIWDERGFFVEISHFSRDSIQVQEGQWVERGALLGKCGNSGYSPQPHIHIQAQATEKIGAQTLPFSFMDYVADNTFFANDRPKEGDRVEPLFVDKTLNQKMSFMLDDRFNFEVYRDGKKEGYLDMVVKAAADGSFYLDSGKGKLFFDKQSGTFYVYHVAGSDRLLNDLFLALPRMPLSYRENMKWTDHVPVGVASSGIKKELIRFAGSFRHSLAQATGTFEFKSKDVIEGKVSSTALNFERNLRVELDEFVGFKSVKVDNIEIRRQGNEMVRG